MSCRAAGPGKAEIRVGAGGGRSGNRGSGVRGGPTLYSPPPPGPPDDLLQAELEMVLAQMPRFALRASVGGAAQQARSAGDVLALTRPSAATLAAERRSLTHLC